MDADIREMVRCIVCSELRPNTGCSHLAGSGSVPTNAYGLAYVKEVGNVFIIVDAGYGWIEAFLVRDRTSNSGIKCLRTVFTRFGVPEVLVTDNAPEFASDTNNCLMLQGTRKMGSPPYHHKANGLAERAVQTVKTALRSWKLSSVHMDFCKRCSCIRVSSRSRGKSPAEIVFGRRLRVPVVSNHQQGDDVWYTPKKDGPTRHATYVMTRGQNTSWILKDNNLTLTSNNKIAPVGCGNTTSDRENPPVDIKEDDKIDMECPSTETEAPIIPDEATATPRAAGPQRSCRVSKPVIRCGFDS